MNNLNAKIVQISATSATQFFPSRIYALSEEGTIWFAQHSGDTELRWERLPLPGEMEAADRVQEQYRKAGITY